MLAINQHRRTAAALVASAAILLAGCGPAASPTWTYVPLSVDTSTAAPSAAASASPAPASPADTASPTPASSPADAASPAPSAAASPQGS